MTDANTLEYNRLKENVAKSPAYKAGTKAHYDSHVHMLPCVVLEVIEPGNGVFVTSGKLRIKVTKDTGPYKKGEEMEVTGYHTIPKGHRKSSTYGKYKLNKWYRWVK